jgi:hypothetical protein
MKRFQVIARNRMTSASGFTWFAREPELIVGAEGARILTEINRLPQPLLLAHAKISVGSWRLQARFAAAAGDLASHPLLFL